VSAFDEAQTRLGLNTTSPTQTLDVVGRARVSGASEFIGNVYGENVSGGDLFLRASEHATPGDIFLGNVWVVRYIEKEGANWVGKFCVHGCGNSVAALEVATDYVTNQNRIAAEFHTDGNTTATTGIRISAGLDTPASGGDITWLDLRDGNHDPLSVVEYTTGTPFVQFAAASDARLKKNIEDTKVDGLGVVQSIPLRSFDFIDGKKPHQPIGYVAQEVQGAWPQMVSEGEDGMLRVGDGVLTPVLVKAIQQLAEQVELLEDQVAELSWTCGGYQ